MGDELRVALRVDETVWGFLCLHRSGPTGFTAAKAAAMAAVAPHGGEAIRRVVATMAARRDSTDAPHAVLLVSEDLVVGVAGAIDELADDYSITVGEPLPLSLSAVVRRLEAIERDETGSVGSPPPAIRVTTASGAVVGVHAARLRDADGAGPIVLTLVPATPVQRSSLLLAAHGLTPAQRRVATLVVQGCTTRQIVVDLGISAYTVQDHLKAVFDKMGVRSRRELVATLMRPAN